jgi:hypothetical protein
VVLARERGSVVVEDGHGAPDRLACDRGSRAPIVAGWFVEDKTQIH